MTTVIKVENLGKKYLLSHQAQRQPYVALRDVIAERTAALGRKLLHPFRNSSLITHHSSQEEFWALKDVSFEIKQGDRVGIIGRNGAGKSTLLKILSRIVEPTTGRVKIKGRVASLLEVGTGFHPELTGRENIYLNGAILGMTRVEIKKKFDEIVDFAEIEKFLDTPVKRYSSGMYVRLAFAVAAHLEPEILLVDEVLAVGDAQFQKKCLGKMEDVSTKEGRTVLFVSHNMGAISLLCQKTISIITGKIIGYGNTADVIKKYSDGIDESIIEWVRPPYTKENQFLEFQRISVMTMANNSKDIFDCNEPIKINIKYIIKKKITGCQIGVRVYNSEGLVIFSTADTDYTNVSALPREAGFYDANFIVGPNFLSPGYYRLHISAHLPHRNVYETFERTVIFKVSTIGWLGAYDGRLGIVSPKIPWVTKKYTRSLPGLTTTTTSPVTNPS